MNALIQHTADKLRRDAQFAPDKPDETPETSAIALWLAAVGEPMAVSRVALSIATLSNDTRTLTAQQCELFESLVARRLADEPLAYLTGKQEFLGLDFCARPGALVPRRETELLGKAALMRARELVSQRGAISILDLCTGAGNLAVSLAAGVPDARVWASDLDPPALEIAAENVKLHNVGDRVMLMQGDLFGALQTIDPVPGPFDLIVCNPPYIPSRKAQNMPREVGGLEPVAAFDGGDFGLSVLLRLINEASSHLTPGGSLGFELGAGQGSYIEKRLAARKEMEMPEQILDAHGTIRAFMVRHAS